MTGVEIPTPPAPTPVRLRRDDVCVAVLDLSTRCEDPAAVCSAVVPPTRALLDAARAAGAPVAFTVSVSEPERGRSAVARNLDPGPAEPVFRPDDYDKLADDGLLGFVRNTGASTLVLCGSSTNVCILYTATSAVRRHALDVVIPVDCVNAKTDYQQGYALYQLTSLPSARKRRDVTLTQSRMLVFE